MAYVTKKTEYEVRWNEMDESEYELSPKVEVKPDYIGAKKRAYELVMNETNISGCHVSDVEIYEIRREEERVETVTKQSIEEALLKPFTERTIEPVAAPYHEVTPPRANTVEVASKPYDPNDDIPF